MVLGGTQWEIIRKNLIFQKIKSICLTLKFWEWKKVTHKSNYNVGVSNSSIEAYEQKVRIPSLPVAYRLSEVLGCSIDYLVGKSHELDKYYLLSQNDKDKVIDFIESLSSKK